MKEKNLIAKSIINSKSKEEVKKYFKQKVYTTVIPRNVRLAEAPSYGMPINIYDTRSAGAESYRLLAEEVMNRGDEE